MPDNPIILDIQGEDGFTLDMQDSDGLDFEAQPFSKGDPGKSAYQVAVDNGFSGTEEEWLASLDGSDGFSPTATVVKVGDTATITITDKDGTTTATVKDGSDGASDWDDITNKPNFATVATSGDYDDLTDKPEIDDVYWCTYGTTTSAEIETALTAGKVPMVRYQDYVYTLRYRNSATNHRFVCNYGGKEKSVACQSGTWIPNGDLTFLTTSYTAPVTSVNGQTGAVTVSVPTKVSDLTNDSGFITSYTETDPVFSASAAAGISSSDIDAWDGKQSALTFDNTPTSGSDNPVKSGGVYTALESKAETATITTGEDLNDVTTPGFYYVMSGVSNSPSSLFNDPYGIVVVGQNAVGSYILQTFFAARPGYEGIAQRLYFSSAWHDWYRIGDVHTDSNLSRVENGTTASRAYSVGDYVTINGVLCKITASVASGGTLTKNTNYTVVTGGLASEFVTALGDVETLLASI